MYPKAYPAILFAQAFRDTRSYPISSLRFGRRLTAYFFYGCTFPSSVLTPFGCQNSAPRIGRRRLILLFCLFKLFGTLVVTVFLLYASAGALQHISFTGVRFPRMYRGILPRYNAPRIVRSKAYDTGRLFLIAHQTKKARSRRASCLVRNKGLEPLTSSM